MENRKDVTVPMPGDMVEKIDGQLGYGDSRAAWIREAVRQRLEQEGHDMEGNPKKATVPTAN
ncbi:MULTISPECIES: ribbon-helix-helix domain-containing protein [Halorussus]|uniref:ribbon-helix-helix domain-containing protein n=1 Tax=Halorussus TaxID=1070314 RepID=UPI00209E0B21|nr:ribbon-helix-helix domain-containing protein [Halorussus vallis]USZ75688.1 ribbon-helix-helix domain-containing protein [Halorussus vallis]USZ75763.1 ribbon-helix-helix domain-containing protein [Halorussus vallis]